MGFAILVTVLIISAYWVTMFVCGSVLANLRSRKFLFLTLLISMIVMFIAMFIGVKLIVQGLLMGGL